MYIGKKERERKKRKRQSRLLNIHPGGQTATVMNTTLSENYSVLYPVVVEDEKGSRRQVDGRAHARARAHNEHPGVKEGKASRREQTCISGPPVNLQEKSVEQINYKCHNTIKAKFNLSTWCPSVTVKQKAGTPPFFLY